jgi:hypothetical protein
MAKNRMTLQRFLKTKTANVYFQPDTNIKLKFPCIVYSRARLDNTFANDEIYKLDHGYKIIYIHSDPDDPLVDELVRIPTCRFQREYNVDGLYHDEYIIYWN